MDEWVEARKCGGKEASSLVVESSRDHELDTRYCLLFLGLIVCRPEKNRALLSPSPTALRCACAVLCNVCCAVLVGAVRRRVAATKCCSCSTFLFLAMHVVKGKDDTTTQDFLTGACAGLDLLLGFVGLLRPGRR